MQFAGSGLDINSDGTRAVVGSHYYPSPARGRVYIFDKLGGTWTLTATLENPEGTTAGWFGQSVSFDSTGNKLLAGAWLNSTNGRAYAYDYRIKCMVTHSYFYTRKR